MKSQPSHCFDFHFNNGVEGLFVVMEACDQACCQYSSISDAGFKIRLALEELIVNAINYGSVPDREIEFDVHLKIKVQSVFLSIEDDALLFNSTQAPAPDLDSDLESRRIGGLGIHLLKSLFQEFHYISHNNQNRTELILRAKTP